MASWHFGSINSTLSTASMRRVKLGDDVLFVAFLSCENRLLDEVPLSRAEIHLHREISDSK
jgi:hypothetical protein